jgi:hypothetical protein
MTKIWEIPKAAQHRSKGPQLVDLRGFSIKSVIWGVDDDDDDDESPGEDEDCDSMMENHEQDSCVSDMDSIEGGGGRWIPTLSHESPKHPTRLSVSSEAL